MFTLYFRSGRRAHPAFRDWFSSFCRELISARAPRVWATAAPASAASSGFSLCPVRRGREHDADIVATRARLRRGSHRRPRRHSGPMPRTRDPTGSERGARESAAPSASRPRCSRAGSAAVELTVNGRGRNRGLGLLDDVTSANGGGSGRCSRCAGIRRPPVAAGPSVLDRAPAIPCSRGGGLSRACATRHSAGLAAIARVWIAPYG